MSISTVQQTFLPHGPQGRGQVWRTIEAVGLTQVYARAYRVFLWLSMVQIIGIGAAIVLPVMSGVIAITAGFASASRDCPSVAASVACALGVRECAPRI